MFAECPVPVETAVSVEAADKKFFFLGVVRFCVQAASQWSIGIDLEQIVNMERLRQDSQKHFGYL